MLIEVLIARLTEGVFKHLEEEGDVSDKIREWFRGDIPPLLFQLILARSWTTFARTYPQWAAIFFDQYFLYRAIPLLVQCLVRTNPPKPVALAVILADQMSLTSTTRERWLADIMPVASYFLSELERDLRTEFQPLFASYALGDTGWRATESADFVIALWQELLQTLATLRNDFYAAIASWNAKALTISGQHHERRAEKFHLRYLGQAYAALGEAQRAVEYYEAALTLFRAEGDHLGEANALKELGDTLALQKLNDEAQVRYEAALSLFRAVGNRLGETNVLQALGKMEARAITDETFLYEVYFSLSTETMNIGGDLEVIVEVRPATLAKNADYQLNIPRYDIEVSKLNLVVSSTKFDFLRDSVASLPLFAPTDYRALQRATFSLVGLRSGSADISVGLYRGGYYQGQIKKQVIVSPILNDEIKTIIVCDEVSYQVQLFLSSEIVSLGQELEVIVELKPAAFAQDRGYLLNVPSDEVNRSQLNLILDAPGFGFLQDRAASLPLMNSTYYTSPQRAIFRLVALLPGSTHISMDLCRGNEYETNIKRQVTIAGMSGQVSVADFLPWESIKELGAKSFEVEVSYQVQVSLSAETVSLDGELEVIVELKPATSGEDKGCLLNVPLYEVNGNDLNLLLEAPGFQFLQSRVASLPLLERTDGNQSQAARFSLIPLRPGIHQITVELYCGNDYEKEIKKRIRVAGIDENVTLSRPLVLSPRPVAQPDYVLQVQTRWDEGGSACSFHYHLTSTHASLLLTGGVRAQSESLSRVQVERLRDSWQLLLGEMAGGVAMEVRSRLAAFGGYLYEMLLPDTLRQELRVLGGVRRVAHSKGRTLLLVADEDAWLPWELLYDDQGRKFLAERVIVGRWLRELGDVPPYEFPVGQVNMAYYESAAQEHEWWVDLIEPPGSPPADSLSIRILEASTVFNPLRGLHLLRYGEKMGAGNWEGPVSLADANQEESIEGLVQPIKLNLYRNRPLVSLGYVTSGRPELTNLIEEWAPTFVRAGCSAFVGPLWTVSPAVEAAFMSAFYHYLWTGGSLGEAFQAGRQLARAANPESLDWLAYVLFGDPMARPYRPIKSEGYAVVEPIGQSIDEPLRAGVRTRFRVGLRRTPPVWLKERVIEVEEALEFNEPRVHLVAFDLPVEPKGAIELVRTAQGEYLGWFSVLVPPEMVDEEVELQVHFADGRKRIQSVMLSFDVIDGKTEEEAVS